MKILDILATIGLITVLRLGCKAAVWANEIIQENTHNDNKRDGH